MRATKLRSTAAVSHLLTGFLEGCLVSKSLGQTDLIGLSLLSFFNAVITTSSLSTVLLLLVPHGGRCRISVMIRR